MPDLFDKAQEREEQLLQDSLAATLGRGAQPEADATGECLYCFEPILAEASNPRFCDVICRNSFDKTQRILRNKR